MAPVESSQESKESDSNEQNGPLGNSGDKFWQPFAGNQITSPPTESLLTGNSQSQPSTSSSEAESKADNKKGKKLSLADYKKRQQEERKKQEEEKAKEEAERTRQQKNRLSTDAVTAVLSSAVQAATNGSRVQSVTSSDVAWLSSLVGMNLTGSPNTLGEQSQELTQSTAERLSDLAQATEQVLNTVRAANVLAALTAKNRYRK